MNYACPLCERLAMDLVDDRAEHVVAWRDAGAERDGTVIVAPRQHVRSLSSLDDAGYQAVWELVAAVQGEMGLSWALSGSMSPCTLLDGRVTDHAHVVVVPRG